ncbi:MAG: hypothetical protein ABSA16_13390 [Thermoguttaceae bacterium]
MTFRFESLDWQALDHLVQGVCDTIAELGQELWQKYVADMGAGGTRE